MGTLLALGLLAPIIKPLLIAAFKIADVLLQALAKKNSANYKAETEAVRPPVPSLYSSEELSAIADYLRWKFHTERVCINTLQERKLVCWVWNEDDKILVKGNDVVFKYDLPGNAPRVTRFYLPDGSWWTGMPLPQLSKEDLKKDVNNVLSTDLLEYSTRMLGAAADEGEIIFDAAKGLGMSPEEFGEVYGTDLYMQAWEEGLVECGFSTAKALGNGKFSVSFDQSALPNPEEL